MKKIRFIACMLLCAVMMMYVAGAESIDTVVFEYENENMTVIFDGAQTDNEGLYKSIADYLVYGKTEYDAAPMSLCWLFGHDITTTTPTTIKHKVSKASPRCLKETHQVQKCSKCDYVKDEVISSGYITCCPAD